MLGQAGVGPMTAFKPNLHAPESKMTLGIPFLVNHSGVVTRNSYLMSTKRFDEAASITKVQVSVLAGVPPSFPIKLVP